MSLPACFAVRTSGRSRQRTIVAASSVALIFLAASDGQAQSARVAVIAPAYQSWTFDQPVPLDSLTVLDASQISAPFLISLPFASRFALSASGAAFTSSVSTEGASGSESRTLSGITDVRLRLTGPLIGDALQFTLGLNAPTGNRGLSLSENDILRVVAAPALGAQVTVPGVGFGGTLGLVAARMSGNWALALGASVEHRGAYSPIEAVITGNSATTELAPGAAMHFSLGADGPMGIHRLTLGFSADLYGTDEVRSTIGSRTQIDQYQLGPTGMVTAALQVGGTGFRDLTFRITDRYRSTFSDSAGTSIEGSSGNYFEGSVSGLLGRAGGSAVLLGLDVRQHTGLPVDDGFIGAGLTSLGLTVGLSLPTGGAEWRPTFRYSYGTLKTGRVETKMTGLSAGLSLSAR